MARSGKSLKKSNCGRPRRKVHRHTNVADRQTKGENRQSTLILLNKPYGIVSQFSGGDRNLAELISKPDVYPAGRLDKDSEGLLLLTDNGQLQHRIAHPDHKLEKYYWVQVEGNVTEKVLKQLCTGVALRDGPATALSAIEIDPPEELWTRTPPIRKRQSIPTGWIELCINEGRNRQVRRMTAAAGLPTLRLIRHRIGNWSIANIPSGEYETILVRKESFK